MSYEGSWGSSPIRRRMDVGVTTIDLLNLGDYREFQLEMHGIQVGVAGDFVLQFSVDNGATWDVTAANYLDYTDGSVLATAGVPIQALAVSTPIAGFIEIMNFNAPWPASAIQRIGRLGSSTQSKTGPTYHNTLVARNAIRVLSTQPLTRNLGVVLRTRKG